MKVNITIERKSRLVIMFSGQFMAAGTFTEWDISTLYVIFVRAMVNGGKANPQIDDMWFATQLGRTSWQCQSFIFYSEILEPDTHTVEIEWCMSDGYPYGGRVASRTLVVIALPE